MGAPEIVRNEEIEAGSCETCSTNDVNEIVVGEVHCGPIEDSCVRPNESCCMREEVGEKEGFESRISCV